MICPILPEIQLLRDTFAGKIFSDFWRPKNISEKRSEFYRQKCRAGVRTKLLFLVVIISHLQMGSRKTKPDPWKTQMRLLKITTWYGRLRDTFAGKILISFQKYFSVSRNLKIFYRQKCRAAAVFLYTQVEFEFEFELKILI